MAKRRSKRSKRGARKVSKQGAVWHLSAEEATMLNKPQYNGYACGHGLHGNPGYDRRAQQRAFKREMQQEKASYRGLLPLWAPDSARVPFGLTPLARK